MKNKMLMNIASSFLIGFGLSGFGEIIGGFLGWVYGVSIAFGIILIKFEIFYNK